MKEEELVTYHVGGDVAGSDWARTHASDEIVSKHRERTREKRGR